MRFVSGLPNDEIMRLVRRKSPLGCGDIPIFRRNKSETGFNRTGWPASQSHVGNYSDPSREHFPRCATLALSTAYPAAPRKMRLENSEASQAAYEGSIPFARSNDFNSLGIVSGNFARHFPGRIALGTANDDIIRCETLRFVALVKGSVAPRDATGSLSSFSRFDHPLLRHPSLRRLV
jgi:hypothetical protein